MDSRNKDLCAQCVACCNYVVVEIDKPTSKNDYNNILWFLLHRDVHVYINFDHEWYLELITPCTKIDQKTKLCSDYSNRPKVCRDYSQKECTCHNNEPVEKEYFKTADDFKKYLIRKKIDYIFKK